MNDGTLGLATKLLIKAQGTNFDAEAAALTERAYRLLANALNTHDDEVAAAGVARKRERRQLRDRRSGPGDRPAASATSMPFRVTSPATAHTRLVGWIDPPGRSQVDLRV